MWRPPCEKQCRVVFPFFLHPAALPPARPAGPSYATMPPKNAQKGGAAQSKKADQKKKEKIIEVSGRVAPCGCVCMCLPAGWPPPAPVPLLLYVFPGRVCPVLPPSVLRLVYLYPRLQCRPAWPHGTRVHHQAPWH